MDKEGNVWYLRALGVTPVADLIAGSMAGATAVCVTYPLDLLRTRLAWRTSGIGATQQAPAAAGQAHHGFLGGVRRSAMASMLLRLAQREGVPGLYKGMSPTLLGIFPYAGLKFFVYQYLKTLYVKEKAVQQHLEHQREVKIGTSMKLVFGACAGLVAQTVTYPLDVVRRRMQVQDMAVVVGESAQGVQQQAQQQHIRSSWHGLRMIHQTAGVTKGLYAGLSLNYLKVIPSTAIGFAVYDTAKEYLDHKTSI